MEINIKEVKREGEYNIDTDEQPEIILEISGKMAVYGDASYEEFVQKIEALCNEYAI